MNRWIVIGVGLIVALLGEPLAGAMLVLGFEAGEAFEHKESQP